MDDNLYLFELQLHLLDLLGLVRHDLSHFCCIYGLGFCHKKVGEVLNLYFKVQHGRTKIQTL